MGFCKVLVFFTLASLGVILAEEVANQPQAPPPPTPQQNEEHRHQEERASIPFVSPFMDMFSQFANSSGSPFSGFFNSRSAAIPGFDIDAHNNSDEHSDRLFLHFPRFAGCNFTTNPGLACFSCRQRINCLRSNVGIVTRCNFFSPYCSGNGTCSQTPGPLC